MASPAKRAALPLLAAGASGVMLYFGNGLHPLWWLMWLAPLPVLLAAPRLSKPMAWAR